MTAPTSIKRVLITLLFAIPAALQGQGIITTIAGTGTWGFSGDGGPAIAATLEAPQGLAVDSSGTIYFVDHTRIRKITTDGVIATIAGNGTQTPSGDGGPALSAGLGSVTQVALDGNGRLCFADTAAYKLRCITLATGIIQGYGTGAQGFTGDGGDVNSASFWNPTGLAFDSANNMYVSDTGIDTVRRIDAVTNIITTIAGTVGYTAFGGDGGPAVNAYFNQPGILQYFGGALYVADLGNWRVRRIDLNSGLVTTVAGDGSPYRSGDGGPATAAGVSPFTIALDPSGNLFIGGGAYVRMVDTSGTITTIAGDGSGEQGLDDIPATQSDLVPNGLGWDPIATRLLVSADVRVRQIFFTPATTTTLVISPNPGLLGSPVSLQATILPSSATGGVRFYENGFLLGTAPVNAGVAIFPWTAPSVSTYSIRAVYGGDPADNLSTSDTQTLTVQLPGSSTAITSSANPSIQGQAVTFTATVTPSTGGEIFFFNGGTQIGSGNFSAGGPAQLTVSNLPLGSNSITATFTGNGTYSASTSPVLTQVVQASTVTTLASALNPSTYGAAVTLSATVTPAAATGTVQFFNGGTLLGSATLSSGQAQFTTSNLPTGTDSLTATYNGSGNYAGSTSSPLSQVVGVVSSSTALSSAPNPSVAGAAVTLTAMVTPATATGTVQFFNGAASLGSAPLSSGQAQLAITSLPAGTDNLTATYSGDSNFAVSTSAAVAQVVKATTITTLTGNPNPSQFGGAVVLTASVTPASATGAVQFFNGGTLLGTTNLSSGQAQLTVSSLAVGSSSLTAVYAGDGADVGSTSAALSQVVNPVTTTTTLSSTPNPSNAGATVTLTATVTPAAATGTVQFLYGSSVLGSAALSGGVAQISVSTLPAGSDSLTAAYSGSTNYATSTSSAILQVVKAITTTVLVSNPNPAAPGAAVTLTATVTPSTATGTVQFFNGNTLLGSASLSGGAAQLSVSNLPTGSNALSATYGGDANDTSSGSTTITQVVKTVTTTYLNSFWNPTISGSPATFQASVSPQPPSGTVQFFNGSTLLGSVSWTGSPVQFSVSNLPLGSNSITAVYSGDANDAGSTSAVVVQVVKTGTSTGLTANPYPANAGAPVTLTASVSPSAATGTMQFSFNGTVLGTTSISGGQAQLVVSNLPVGTDTVVADYSGDANYGISEGSNVAWVRTVTTTALASTPNPAAQGAVVTLTATVSPSAATGTVQFFNNGSLLGSATLSGGQAQYSSSTLPAGTDSLTANYLGGGNYSNSASTAISQVVTVPTTTLLATSPNPSAFGAGVALTATVSPSAATGAVQFFNNGSLIGSATLSSGQAQLSISNLPLGSNALTAAYGGDTNDAASTSVVVSQVVKNPTAATLTGNPNPSTVNAAVTLTATVSPATATGPIQFYNNGTLLGSSTLNSGSAQLVISNLPTGTNLLSAMYNGDAQDFAATPASLSQVVKNATTISLTSSPNPSTQGATVTLNATVSPSSATGIVQFLNGNMLIGSASVSGGQAQLALSNLPSGTDSLSAVYSGDAQDFTATSAIVSQVVKAATTITLTGNPNPATVGGTVTLTATVAPNSATGTVQFFNGGTLLGSASVSGGQALLALSTLPAGSNALTATYGGDGQDFGSSSAVFSEVVNLIGTTTTLASTPNPATVGSAVTLTATVSPSAAAGTVQFFSNGSLLGTSTLSGGHAQLSTSSLAVGTDSLTATFQGGGNYAASTSAADSQVVNLTSTTTTLTSSANPSTFGAAVTLTANVSPSSATGTVQFFNGSTLLGSATLSSGSAQLSISTLSAGSHSLTATYGGNTTDASSTSSTLMQTVNKVNSATTLTASPASPQKAGVTITFTASVAPTTATGTVQFLDGSTVIGSATVSNGVATFATSSLADGTHSIKASYLGDGNVNASQSAVLSYLIKH